MSTPKFATRLMCLTCETLQIVTEYKIVRNIGQVAILPCGTGKQHERLPWMRFSPLEGDGIIDPLTKEFYLLAPSQIEELKRVA